MRKFAEIVDSSGKFLQESFVRDIRLVSKYASEIEANLQVISKYNKSPEKQHYFVPMCNVVVLTKVSIKGNYLTYFKPVLPLWRNRVDGFC